MKKIVIMPGGFHPFHAGHYALYQSAKKAFPDANIYVAATDDTKTRPFPFDVKQKLARLSGVDPKHFVQVKNTFKADEITSKYDPNRDVLIFVRSEKDKSEYPIPGRTKKDGTPAYFQRWTGRNLQPFGKQGYLAYLPTVEFGPGIKSASEIRNSWPNLNDRQKLAMIMSLYPAAQKNTKLAQNVVQLMNASISGELSEHFKKINNRPISESLLKKLNNLKDSTMKLINLFENAKEQDSGDFSNDLSRSAINATADENEVLAFIRRHYPEAPNTQAAFIKFVIHSLQHSEEDALQHSKEIETLQNELKKLNRKISDLEQSQRNNDL